MSTLLEYRKKLRDIFLISAKNDLKSWDNSSDDYWSPNYFNNSDKKISSYFRFSDSGESAKKYIRVCNRIGDTYLSTTGEDYFVSYKFWIFPTDFKVYSAVNKIKKHFKKIKYDESDATQISVLSSALNSIENNFQKEIRKNKLNQILKIK